LKNHSNDIHFIGFRQSEKKPDDQNNKFCEEKMKQMKQMKKETAVFTAICGIVIFLLMLPGCSTTAVNGNAGTDGKDSGVPSLSLVGTCALTYALETCIVGHYAFVADYNSGCRIIDISKPSAPVLVQTVCFKEIWGVHASGDYVYSAGGLEGLWIYKINTSAASVADIISDAHVYIPSEEVMGADVSGNYAYIADGNHGLRIVNISDPKSPTLAGTCATGYAEKVSVFGGYAYVADGANGLRIIDISDPAKPAIIGTCSTSDAYDVRISGSYAYVADNIDGLRIIDITDPAKPSLVGTCTGIGKATGVFVSGNYAYVADVTNGIRIIDISSPSKPTIVKTYACVSAYDIIISGNYAYVADTANGLLIYKID
jgi:hypothetical protein